MLDDINAGTDMIGEYLNSTDETKKLIGRKIRLLLSISDRYYRQHNLEGDERGDIIKIVNARFKRLPGYEFTDNLVNQNVCYHAMEYLLGNIDLAEMKKKEYCETQFVGNFDMLTLDDTFKKDVFLAKQRFGYPFLGVCITYNYNKSDPKYKIEHIFIIIGEDKNGEPIIFHKPGSNPYTIILGFESIKRSYGGELFFRGIQNTKSSDL